ncbi:hypothetical protein [Leptolyngbya sp. AN10]|uniref:hypothetical protein n=1 Tax=Leptolyngbya sp. AN10 TaxID=3423365 RepID=UPI003D31F221
MSPLPSTPPLIQLKAHTVAGNPLYQQAIAQALYLHRVFSNKPLSPGAYRLAATQYTAYL